MAELVLPLCSGAEGLRQARIESSNLLQSYPILPLTSKDFWSLHFAAMADFLIRTESPWGCSLRLHLNQRCYRVSFGDFLFQFLAPADFFFDIFSYWRSHLKLLTKVYNLGVVLGSLFLSEDVFANHLLRKICYRKLQKGQKDGKVQKKKSEAQGRSHRGLASICSQRKALKCEVDL